MIAVMCGFSVIYVINGSARTVLILTMEPYQKRLFVSHADLCDLLSIHGRNKATQLLEVYVS